MVMLLLPLVSAGAICKNPHRFAIIEIRGVHKMKPEPWVSLEEIAEHLGVSTDTIHRWIRAKRIPAHRVGRLWKFKVSDVDEWVRAGKVAGKEPL